MSLEDALKENTEAVRSLIAAFQALTVPVVTLPKETKAPKSALTVDDVPSPSTATPPAAPLPKAEKPDTAAPSVAIEPQESTAATEVTYQQVTDAFLAVFKADREKGLAALKAFGVKKAPELKPEQYAAFIAELQK